MLHPTRLALPLTLILAAAACAPESPPDAAAEVTTAAVTAEEPDEFEVWTGAAEWSDLAIPGVPTGARMAVLEGDPAGDGAFVMRIDFPDGFAFPPHTHPTDEHLTVLEGTFLVGMGERVDTAAMQRVPAGGVVTAPAGMAHYARAEGRTIVQINGKGPFAVVLVE